MTELAPFIQFTPEAILGLGVVMLLFGYLAPLRIVRGRLADKDVVIADLRRANAALHANNTALLRGNNVTVQVLEATAETVGGDTNGDQVV